MSLSCYDLCAKDSKRRKGDTCGLQVSAVGANVASAVRFWPGFVHFGQQHVWEASPEQPLPRLTRFQVRAKLARGSAQGQNLKPSVVNED